MLDHLTFLEFIIIAILGAVVGFISALSANDSVKEARGKELSQTAWITYVILNCLFGALFQWATPFLYAVLLIIITVLQLINMEGPKRRVSWNILAALYSFLLILSVIYHRTENKFEPLWLFWLIPILLPFIAGAIGHFKVNGLARRKDNGDKEKMSSVDLVGIIVSWTLVVILALVVLALALI